MGTASEWLREQSSGSPVSANLCGAFSFRSKAPNPNSKACKHGETSAAESAIFPQRTFQVDILKQTPACLPATPLTPGHSGSTCVLASLGNARYLVMRKCAQRCSSGVERIKRSSSSSERRRGSHAYQVVCFRNDWQRINMIAKYQLSLESLHVSQLFPFIAFMQVWEEFVDTSDR